MKRCSTSLSTREMQIKSTMIKGLVHTYFDGYAHKDNTSVHSMKRMWRNWNSHVAKGNINRTAILENKSGSSSKSQT